MPLTVKPLVPEPNDAVDAAPQSPKTYKGWQAYLSNVRAPAKRVQKPLGAGLAVLLEPSGVKTFLARLRRRGEKNPRTIRIGAFPAVSVADARRKLAEMKSVIREDRTPGSGRSPARIERACWIARSPLGSQPISTIWHARLRQPRREAQVFSSFRRAMRFVEENAANVVELTDVARATGVRVRALQLAFHRFHDRTPMA